MERETLLQHRVVMADSSGHYQPSPSDPSEPFVEVVNSDIGKCVQEACCKAFAIHHSIVPSLQDNRSK